MYYRWLNLGCRLVLESETRIIDSIKALTGTQSGSTADIGHILSLSRPPIGGGGSALLSTCQPTSKMPDKAPGTRHILYDCGMQEACRLGCERSRGLSRKWDVLISTGPVPALIRSTQPPAEDTFVNGTIPFGTTRCASAKGLNYSVGGVAQTDSSKSIRVWAWEHRPTDLSASLWCHSRFCHRDLHKVGLIVYILLRMQVIIPGFVSTAHRSR